MADMTGGMDPVKLAIHAGGHILLVSPFALAGNL